MASRRAALAFLLAVTLLMAASPSPVAAEDFDFYFFILLWPGTYCSFKRGCCKPTTGYPAQDFFISSFEPYNSTTGKAVQRCNGAAFDSEKLPSEDDDLQLYWSSIKCPCNNGVTSWKNAWKYYGICSDMNQTDYFSSALAIWAKVDLLDVLEQEGISPTDKKTYSVQSIVDAVKEHIGVTPVIRCGLSPTKYPDDYLLFEIYLCVDKDAETLIDCPVPRKFKCSDSILFPPYNSSMLNTTCSTTVDEAPLLHPSSSQRDRVFENTIRMPVVSDVDQ